MIEGLTNWYGPSFLEIKNDSEQHRGHKGMIERVTTESPETHFKIILVSDAFRSLTRIERHRDLYKVLAKILEEGEFLEIHALSLRLLSPEEFEMNL